MKNKQMIWIAFLIFAVAGMQIVGAYTSITGISNSYYSTSYQYQPSFQTYYGSSLSTYWPILSNPDQCTARQDLLLEVAPGGCTPAVVRSDLLADQNVPVFCQINALQVNPLINIKGVSNIVFTGKYPSLVSGVGFHPANAALNTKDTLMGSPLSSNLGYVVVVLKQTKNESALPGSVSLNLTGQIQYNSGNAFGIGATDFLLTPVTDAQWETKRLENTFWQGRYSVRLDDANANSAIVSIYNGEQRIARTQVQLGQTSQPIYVPGTYCQFGLQIQYLNYQKPQDKARIEVTNGDGADSLDVYTGSSFLNGQCTVRSININSDGTTGNVVVNCGSSNLMTLYLTPRFNNQIIPEDGVKFNNDYGKATLCSYTDTSGNVYSLTRAPGADSLWVGFTAKDSSTKDIAVSDSVTKIQTELTLRCNAKTGKGDVLKDETLPPNSNNQDTESIFNTAIKAYQSVPNDFPSEKQDTTTNPDYYGKIALAYGALALAKESGTVTGYSKPQTISTILNQLINLYPDQSDSYKNQLNELSQVDSSAAAGVASINNQYTTIRLVSLSQPTQTATSTATFDFGTQSCKIIKGQEKDCGPNGAKIKLTDFDGAKATIQTNCVVKSSGASSTASTTSGTQEVFNKDNALGSPITVTMGESMTLCGLPFVYRDTDLPSVARIKLLPVASGTQTQTNVTVHIGIEKRNIQLTPEKAKEKAENINKSIQQWESISKNLETIETGLKTACFATSAILTVENFLGGAGGAATARQAAMTGDHGWTKRCNDALTTGKIDRLNNGDSKTYESVTYSSLTQCFNGEEKYINDDINSRTSTLNQVNSVLKGIEQNNNQNGVVNQDAATEALYKQLKGDCPDVKLPDKQERLDKPGTYYYPYTYQQLRDVYYDCLLKNKDPSAGQSARGAIEDAVKEANANVATFSQIAKSAAAGGLENKAVASPIAQGQSTISAVAIPINSDGTLNGFKVASASKSYITSSGASYAFLIRQPSVRTQGSQGSAGGQPGLQASSTIPFAIVLVNKVASGFSPVAVYSYSEANSEAILQPIQGYDGTTGATTFMSDNKIYQFQELGQGLAGNTIRQQDQKVLYFTSGTDKDRPALVPFDVVNGWYAKVEASSISLGSNSISAYDASGLPVRWQICNVGDDGAIGSQDQCQLVTSASSGATILGLDQKTSNDLVQRSRTALMNAASQKPAKGGYVKIGSNSLAVDYVNPMDSVQCQMFMSPSDCKILFNVCDPVICPSSRCDLGGAYKVANVQQTGIVGSALLCLPNAKDGIVLPVCISGIRNGIDAYVALLKQHRDCLEESVKTGDMVGVCDEIYSVYMCEFFWREIGPLANILLPKLVETASGQGSAMKGGGEYLSVANAWDNAKSSMDYFTNFYAVNSMQAFQLRNLQDAGTQVCQGFVSANVPTSVKNLVKGDSPPQFYARFDTTTYTTATVPATDQYKVFYMIYGGKDSGVSYSVYLKNPPTSGYYYSNPTVTVATGYIAAGQSASETKDFTAPTGYQQLCVRINNDEQCGFKQVSTDFTANYLSDQYAANQLTQTGITKEADCVSGSTNLGSLASNINLGASANELANPEISQRGIVRICSTTNPGLNTEPTRYVNVGYCGTQNMICWLDKQSVSNAISDSAVGLKNQTLADLAQIQQNGQLAVLQSQGVITDTGVAVQKLTELGKQKDDLRTKMNTAGSSIDVTTEAQVLETQTLALVPQLLLNSHKAWGEYIFADLKGIEAEYAFKSVPKKSSTGGNGGTVSTGTSSQPSFTTPIVSTSVKLTKFINSRDLVDEANSNTIVSSLNAGNLKDATRDVASGSYEVCFANLGSSGIYALEKSAESSAWTASTTTLVYSYTESSGLLKWSSVESKVSSDAWISTLKNELITKCSADIVMLGSNYDSNSNINNYVYVNGIKQKIYLAKNSDSSNVIIGVDGLSGLQGLVSNNKIALLTGAADKTNIVNIVGQQLYDNLNLHTISGNLIV